MIIILLAMIIIIIAMKIIIIADENSYSCNNGYRYL